MVILEPIVRASDKCIVSPLKVSGYFYSCYTSFLFTVTCGEFDGHSLARNQDSDGPFETVDPLIKPDERLKDLQKPLGQGPTIIYVPTRKETLRIAEYLCKSGVRAAAYHAKVHFISLPYQNSDESTVSGMTIMFLTVQLLFL